MKYRSLGAILLIAGTAVGAGTLALPLVIAEAGFIPSVILFIGCWLLMTSSALLMLEVNLATHIDDNDLISMASKTLGVGGKIFAWVTYLFLLYSLTAAYITAGSPWVNEAIVHFSGAANNNLSALIFTLLLAFFVFAGTKYVDGLNRLLIIGLTIAFFAILAAAGSHIDVNAFKYYELKPIVYAIPVVITAFGYHVVIPALTSYLHQDRRKLRNSILIGSTIPLVVYIIWLLAVFGNVPLAGDHGLIALHKNHAATTELAHTFADNVAVSWLPIFLQGFSLFVVITSFLGVSLSLFHFLKDGLSKFRLNSKLFIGVFTFVPPIAAALLYPKSFAFVLGFAGIFVALLLGILPALMAWRGRYNLGMIEQPILPGGKAVLLLIIVGFLGVIPIEIFNIISAG